MVAVVGEAVWAVRARSVRRGTAPTLGVVLALGLCLALSLFALTPSARAHGALEAASPPDGGAVATSPTQVVLTFSQPPDPTLSSIRVFDAAGNAVPGVSPAEGVPGRPAQLRAGLSDVLAGGVYTVEWRSVSTVDGHVETGAYAFGVGVTPPPETEEGPVPGVSRWIDAAAAAGRWLLYAGLVLLAGACTTCLIALRGRMPAGGRGLLWLAVALAGVGCGVLTLAERAAVGVPSLLPLFLARTGQYLLALGVAVLACAVAGALVDVWPRRSTFVTLGALAAVAMLAHVLAGHAAAPSSYRLLNVLAQWVHMMAVGVWVGGLAWLLLGIRGAGRADRAEAVGRYSQIAAAGLGAVVVTGLARASVEVGSLTALFDTSYGRTLVVKLCLVAVIAGLGALNRFRLVPALVVHDEAAGRFGLATRTEVVVGSAVLVATAVLVGLVPAVTAAAR